MFAVQSNIVWFFIFIHVANCQRRIENGEKVVGEKRYVVYLVKAPKSKIRYDYWLCGGALVTTDLVVTSAACIKDVDYLYVIAGYNKYVTDQDIDKDPCTSTKKKKVIYTCYPEGYDLIYERPDMWSFIDIGVAKVESPYDFNDETYRTFCSYVPGTIPINTEDKYQRPGMDAIVLGWGHNAIWRKPEDNNNYNQQSLSYASVMILNKKDCRGHFETHGRMPDVISKYMICTLADGNIDEFGVPKGRDPELLQNGCTRRRSLTNNTDAVLEECEYDDEEDETRRIIKEQSNVSMIKMTTKDYVNKTTVETDPTVSKKINLTKSTTAINKRTHSTKRFTVTDRTSLPNRTYLSNGTASSQKSFMYNKTHYFDETVRDTRRNGICQNDHGGPLVTWIGSHEILIGVASVFKVSEDYKCQGPYLYTSTQCNGAFLDCILDKTDFEDFEEDYDDYRRSLNNVTYNKSRRSFCRKSPDGKRHLTTERHISWVNHPAGPADNERHLTNDKNKPSVKEQMPVRNEKNTNKNGIYINQENERNSPIQYNQKSSVNVNNVPNQHHILSKNIAPIINQRGALNNEYIANYQYPSSDRPGIINNKNSPYNGPATNNRPGANNGVALNNGPAQVDGRAQSYEPAINDKSERNNDHILKKGPGLNAKYEQINHGTLILGSASQNKMPSAVINPKPIYEYAASNKPMMRPTLPFRI